MENKIGAGLLVFLVFMIAILSASTVAMYANAQDKESDLEYKEDEINELEKDIEILDDEIKIRDGRINILLYDLEHFECPEQETIYINETEYIYETLYLSNAIFDVNRDRVVDHEDVCSVWAYINNGLPPVQELFYCKYPNAWDLLYDVNADGVVDVGDVDLILEHAGGIW